MTETYKDMKERHIRETMALCQSLREQGASPWIVKNEREAIATRHALELREAWAGDPTGGGFVYQMMLNGAFYCLEMADILKEDGIALETPEDQAKAIRGYSMAMAFYEAHPDGMGII